MTYTIAKIAKLLGVGKTTVRDAIENGNLRATKSGNNTSKFLVTRDDLLSWLKRSGYPISDMRYHFLEGDRILGYGLTAAQQASIKGVEPASNLCRLGILLGMGKVRVVILSLVRNRDEVISTADMLNRDLDRPYLVGLVGEDESTNYGRAADYFDLLLSSDINPDRLAFAVYKLHMKGIKDVGT